MPFYNRSQYIHDAVGSVHRQTRPANEVVIVDDGSRPEEAAALDRYRDSCIVVRQENRGVAAACNVGIVRATSEWIAFLDDDDQWADRRLEVLTKYISEHPECSAVHNAVQVIGTDRVIRKSSMTLQDFLHVHPNPALRSSTMIRRSALVGSGLMNLVLRMDEDYDCFFRVAIHHPFHYVDEVLTLRGHYGDNLSYNVAAECAAANRVLAFYRDLYPSAADYRRYVLALNTTLATRCFYSRKWQSFADVFRWTGQQGVSRVRLAANIAATLVNNKISPPERPIWTPAVKTQ
jgi:glycosyltransferase involved in cell wall biosynthesis